MRVSVVSTSCELKCCHVYGTLCFTVDGVRESLITHVFMCGADFFPFAAAAAFIVAPYYYYYFVRAGCLIFLQLFICTVRLICTHWEI